MLHRDSRFIDLTLPYDESIAGFSSTEAKDFEKDGWNAKWFNIYSHAGTHMDAPFHFGLKGTIDEFEPEQFMGNAWIVDLQHLEPKANIQVNDLGNLVNRISSGDSLILHTNWSKYLDNREMYRNSFPRISVELAQWCVQQKIKMLGVEPPSVADINNLEEVTQIHKILLRGNVIIIEGLCNLEAINEDQVYLMAFPLKIKNGDGAPARVVAVEKFNLDNDQNE